MSYGGKWESMLISLKTIQLTHNNFQLLFSVTVCPAQGHTHNK